ncbi:MAG: hypothetical protein M1815_001550 [Lichina confinis]|nr:MAG: hypothetical protein M1815_001550 [Lichina confinis]
MTTINRSSARFAGFCSAFKLPRATPVKPCWSCRRLANDPNTRYSQGSPFGRQRPLGREPSQPDVLGPLKEGYGRAPSAGSNAQALNSSIPIADFNVKDFSMQDETPAPIQNHHLHILATKHNTHITLSKPDRGAIISVAAGNIGFRKSARGTFDAAFQLAAHVMNRIQNDGLLVQIKRLELVFNGFGVGRQAVTKALLGFEGKRLRDKITRVADSTRVKIGGCRSPKPRRLG